MADAVAAAMGPHPLRTGKMRLFFATPAARAKRGKLASGKIKDWAPFPTELRRCSGVRGVPPAVFFPLTAEVLSSKEFLGHTLFLAARPGEDDPAQPLDK